MKSRWQRRLVGLVLGGILFSALVMVFLSTGPGREALRRSIVWGGNQALHHFAIDAIDGSLWGDFTIRGIRLRDREDQEAISLEALRVRYAFSDLAWGCSNVALVLLEQPRIRAIATSTGGLNLAQLTKTDFEPSDDEASTGLVDLPCIQIDRLAIDGGSARYEADGAVAAWLERLQLATQVGVEGQTAWIDLDTLDLRMAEPQPVRLKMSGRVETAFDASEVEAGPLQLEAALDDGRLTIRDLAFRTDEEELTGILETTLPSELLGRLTEQAELKMGSTFRTELRSASDQWQIKIDGDVSNAPFTWTTAIMPNAWAPSEWTLETWSFESRFQIRSLDPQALHTAAPSGRLGLDFSVAGQSLSPAIEVTSARLGFGGHLDGLTRKRLRLGGSLHDVTFQDNRATFALDGYTGTATISARGIVKPVPALEITEGFVDVRVPSLAPLAPPGLDLGGRLTLTATVHGTPERFDGQGSVLATDIRVDDLRMARFEGSLTSTGALMAPHIKWELDGQKLVILGRSVPEFSVDFRSGPVALGQKLAFEEISLRTADMDWTGHGHSLLSSNGTFVMQRFNVESDAARLTGTATVGASRTPEAVTARVALTDLDFARLPEDWLPQWPSLRGKGQVEVDFRGSPPRAEIDLDLTDVALEADRGTSSLEADVKLDDRQGRVTAVLDGPIAMANVQIDLDPPKNPWDPNGWTRSLAERGPITAAKIDGVTVHLDELPAVVTSSLPVTGTVRAQVRLAPEPQTLKAKARFDGRVLKEAGASEKDLPVTVSADVFWMAGQVGLDAWVDAPAFAATKATDAIVTTCMPADHDAKERSKTARVTARAGAPGRLYDTAAWGRLGENDLQTVVAETRWIDLARTLPIFAGADGPNLEGLLRLDMKVSEGLDVTQVSVTGCQLGVRDLGFTPNLQLDVRADAGGVTATVAADQVRLDKTPQDYMLYVNAQSPVVLKTYLRPDRPTAAPSITGQLALKGLPLQPFGKWMNLPGNALLGRLHTDARVTGTVERPAVVLEGHADGTQIGGQTFPRIGWRAKADLEQATVQFDTMGPNRGRLTASSTVALTDSRIEARVWAEAFDLGFVSESGLIALGVGGQLSTPEDLVVSGPLRRPRPQGTLQIDDLRVVFPQSNLQPLRQGTVRVDIKPEDTASERVDRVDVALDARSGTGKLRTEELTVRLSETRSGAPTTSFSGRLVTEELPVSAGVTNHVDLTVGLEGKSAPDGTNIDVRVEDGFILVTDDSQPELLPLDEPEDIVYVDNLPGGRKKQTSTSSAGPPTRIVVRTVEPIGVRGKQVNAQLEIADDLILRSQGPRSTLKGTFRSVDGFVVLLGRRYTINRASVTFNESVPANPRIDIELQHDFPTVRFGVTVSATAEELQSNEDRAPKDILRFSAQPARFSEAELLQIFLGTDPEELGERDDRPASQQAVGLIASSLVSRIQDQIGDVLPIDTLDVELGENASAISRVTLGKWISRQVFLAYRYRFEAGEDRNASEAVLQYRFIPGWMVELLYGDANIGSLDLLWTKRF